MLANLQFKQKLVGLNLPVRTNTSELSSAEYPRYTTPLVQLVQLTSLTQYTRQLAKTYAALAPAVKKERHCQW